MKELHCQTSIAISATIAKHHQKGENKERAGEHPLGHEAQNDGIVAAAVIKTGQGIACA